MTFETFTIYDFRAGLDLEVEPWKVPADAFIVLENMMFRRGIMRKRSGQSVFGQLGEFVSAETGFANPAGDQYTITLSNTIVIRRSLKVYDDGGVQAMYDTGKGGFTGDGTGSIDYDTGEVDVTFDGAIVGNVDADYHYEIAEDTRGIWEFNRYVGSNLLIGFQDKRISKWNTTYEYFENIPSVGGDYELWDNTNLVWTWAYNDNLWITDNVTYDSSGGFPLHGIRYYNSTVIRDPIADDNSLQYDAGATDLIKTALIIFTHHERVICLNTVEGLASIHYPQRAAGSWVGDPLANDAWRRDKVGSGWSKDAPTNENIVAFAFFGTIPIIGFEHSVWTMDYVGDPNDPFDWRRIAGFRDVSATFSGVEHSSAAAFLGGKGLIYSNGNMVDNLDDKIPNFVYDIDLENIDKAFAGRADEFNQILLAYPSAPSAVKNDAVLVYNYKDNAFSKYDLSCYCFGTWSTASDMTFDDYAGQSFDDLAGLKWGDRSMQAGYPLLLSGGANGYVYIVNDEEATTDVTDWDGTETKIPILFESGRLNPFVKQGRQVLLQQVGFFCTTLTNGEFTVDFYVDDDSDVVETVTVDCSTGSGNKMWVFVDVALSGDFIKMRGYLSDAQLADANIPLQQLEIHAFSFEMAAGAKIKQCD